jgi:hypothetical protein
MQAIVTKYLHATNFQGSRIKATCVSGSVTVPYSYEADEITTHSIALKALIFKLGWADYRGEWVHGSLAHGNGYAWVFVPSP